MGTHMERSSPAAWRSGSYEMLSERARSGFRSDIVIAII